MVELVISPRLVWASTLCLSAILRSYDLEMMLLVIPPHVIFMEIRHNVFGISATKGSTRCPKQMVINVILIPLQVKLTDQDY